MKQVILLLVAIFLLTFPSMASAEIILNDDFNDTLLVDTTKTTAMVDTANSCVRLPNLSMPNAIAMLKYGEGYAVTATDGVIISEIDDATGSLHDTKIPWLTNTRGLAMRQDNMNLWVIGNDYVQYSQFSGGAYSNDPALKTSGLTNVLSVGAVEGTDKAIVLSKAADGKARITRYNKAGVSLTAELDVELDINEPRALSVVDGTPDIVIATKTEKHYLVFDDTTQNYVEDMARKVSGLTDVASVSANQGGVALLDSGQGVYYEDNDAGTPQQVLAYSTGMVSGGLAVSMKPGAYDQAYITDTGEIRYYTYDDATDSMQRVSSLEKTGIALSMSYDHPKEYLSKVITTPQLYDQLRLTADSQMPAGTIIDYYVSSDGGLTFTQVTSGTWQTVPLGQNYVVKALLDTTDVQQTPKILSVQLETSTLSLSNLSVLYIAKNEPGQTLPTNSFPVLVKIGAMIQFEIQSSGFAESVSANLTTGENVSLVPITPVFPTAPEANTWRGTYVPPSSVVDGSDIGITLTAFRGAANKSYTQNPFVRIKGSVLDAVEIAMTR